MNLRRHRKAVSTLCLGAWLFALSVGLAYGCGWQPDLDHEVAVGSLPVGQSHDDGPQPGCEDVCKDQAAVIAKLQAVEDLSSGTGTASSCPASPVVPVIQVLGSPEALDAQPPPPLSVSIRFLRLQL